MSLLSAAAPVVHTTGINWEGSLATASFVVILMTPIFGLTIFILRAFISQAVTKALEPVWSRLNSHSEAIARLQGTEEGKRQAIAAAGVTTNQQK